MRDRENTRDWPVPDGQHSRVSLYAAMHDEIVTHKGKYGIHPCESSEQMHPATKHPLGTTLLCKTVVDDPPAEQH